MAAHQRPEPFRPHSADPAGVVSWIHFGDLHMTAAGEQNDRDLHALVDRVNDAFADAICFVYLPGDVADQGGPEQYAVVREALDRLRVPWCAIVGDHDVHTRSFAPFRDAMSPELRYSFQIGQFRFIALNAFDVPDPGSFAVLPDQLAWLKGEIAATHAAILLLHCYPSDLKQGGPELRALVQNPAVRLIDMGHTHYNEVANDGRTLYTATRSTGQIEEGAVGFSVTNLDGDVVSWRFFPLHDEGPAIMITSPADERLITDPDLPGAIASRPIRVRAKVWSTTPVDQVIATLAARTQAMTNIKGSQIWECFFDSADQSDGVHSLTVAAGTAEDTIRIILGHSAFHPPPRAARDQDNALAAWPEHGLLGTQLGPNKNGKKW